MGRLTPSSSRVRLPEPEPHPVATDMERNTRRSARPQSSTLYVGMDVHKESIAVASVAQEHGAEVISLGTVGTRQCDIDKLLRPLQSQSPQLVWVYAAGPCSYWL